MYDATSRDFLFHLCFVLCILRATGATIVNRTDELKESDIGTGCGLFEVRKIGDEYVVYFLHVPPFYLISSGVRKSAAFVRACACVCVRARHSPLYGHILS